MKKIAILVYAILAICALIICCASYYFGKSIPFSQQWPLYEALRTTAAIIFAVVGAWLAIVYPERLKFSFNRQAEKNSTGKNFGLLFVPAIHSTIILIILLLVGILAPLLRQIPLNDEYREVARGLSYLLVAALTLWQVVIVAMAIAPVEMLMSSAATEDAQKKINEHYGKNRRRVSVSEER